MINALILGTHFEPVFFEFHSAIMEQAHSHRQHCGEIRQQTKNFQSWDRGFFFSVWGTPPSEILKSNFGGFMGPNLTDLDKKIAGAFGARFFRKFTVLLRRRRNFERVQTRECARLRRRCSLIGLLKESETYASYGSDPF